jgi:hypothetical protein
MALEMDKKGIFPPFKPYHSRLLRFKIIIPTIQADNDEGPNIRDGKGDKLRPQQKKEKLHPLKQRDNKREAPTTGARHNKHLPLHCMKHSAKNNKTRMKFEVQNAP